MARRHPPTVRRHRGGVIQLRRSSDVRDEKYRRPVVNIDEVILPQSAYNRFSKDMNPTNELHFESAITHHLVTVGGSANGNRAGFDPLAPDGPGEVAG